MANAIRPGRDLGAKVVVLGSFSQKSRYGHNRNTVLTGSPRNTMTSGFPEFRILVDALKRTWFATCIEPACPVNSAKPVRADSVHRE